MPPARRREALRKPDFRRVFREGPPVSTSQLVVHSARRPEGGPGRYGLAVSKRYGNAVDRNRARRQVRAAVHEAGGVTPGFDFVIVPKAGVKLRVPQMAQELWQIMETRRTGARQDAQ